MVDKAMPNTGDPAQHDFRKRRQPRLSRRTFLGAAASLVLGLFGLVAPAEAQIVALGASNTRGMGVAFEAAYPAQLEAMLRAKGYRGRVLNAGISGDTTAGMLARLDSAVPPDTRVVVLQPGANDLRRRGGGSAARDANIEQIVSRLSARGIQVVMLENDMLRAVPYQYRQADGEHLTPEGYRLLASWLVPKVAPLIGLPPG
jgi:acyl-CoA thioesterase I